MECEPHHYLRILDAKTRAGQCVAKRPRADGPPAFDLYVSNRLDESKVPASQRQGSYASPFAQLADALVRARELAAPYKQNAAVIIHLFKGDHYAVENRFDALNIYIERDAVDLHALNVDVHIKPLSCSHKPASAASVDASLCAAEDETVTIYNKIRERFRMEVFAKLKLERVVIDSLDSVLPFGSPCLSEYRPCCKAVGDSFQDPGIGEYDASRPAGCAMHFKKLNLSDDCQVGEPRTMFKFVANNDAQYYTGFTTNELELLGGGIRNVFYGMNSLFNLTHHGGRLNVTDSVISRINICGAIVKNKYVHSNNQNLGDIGNDHLSNAEKDWIETTQEFQFRWHEYHDHRYYTQPDDDTKYPQTLLIFIGTNVSHLNFHSNPIKAWPLHPVSASNNMQYQGLMFSLDEFPGRVVVRGCSFENNLFRYDSCLDFDVRT